MNYLYKAYYTVLIDLPANQRKERDMAITAPTPVRALDIFHKNLQTMPPKFKPTDYKLTGLFLRYKDDGGGLPSTGTRDWREDAVDLPDSPNPDILNKVVVTPPTQTEMDLK